MRKVAGVVVAAVLGVAACGGPSMDQVRSDALSRVDGMLFFDRKDELRSQLEAATSPDQVTSLIEAAAREDSEEADKYWECAGHAAESLKGGRWEAITTSSDGGEIVTVALTFEASGDASLTEVHRFHQNGGSTDVAASAGWVASHVGKITQWSSDAADLVAQRSWVGGDRPRYSSSHSCNFHFNLKINDSEQVLVGMQYSIGYSQLDFPDKLTFQARG